MPKDHEQQDNAVPDDIIRIARYVKRRTFIRRLRRVLVLLPLTPIAPVVASWVKDDLAEREETKMSDSDWLAYKLVSVLKRYPHLERQTKQSLEAGGTIDKVHIEVVRDKNLQVEDLGRAEFRNAKRRYGFLVYRLAGSTSSIFLYEDSKTGVNRFFVAGGRNGDQSIFDVSGNVSNKSIPHFRNVPRWEATTIINRMEQDIRDTRLYFREAS